MRKFKVARLRNVLLLSLAFGGSSLLFGQVMPAAVSGPNFGAFVSFGGLRTHVIAYTYNALGVDGGVYLQQSPLRGFEVRGATYPFYARYSQSPLTAGYCVDLRQPRLPGFEMVAYFGGGMSLAQDAGPHYVATPAQWSPCWQASQSMTLPMGRWQWKTFDATWTETYTPLRSLSGISLTTGVAYTFSRPGR